MFKWSDYFILAAVIISFVASATYWFNGYKLESLFTAIWVPSILGFAIYFKLLALKSKIKTKLLNK